MAGLRDFLQSGVGQVAFPAAMGLAGYANPRGAQTMMGGMEMVLQAQAEQQKQKAMQEALSGAVTDPAPPSTDAKMAERSTALPNDMKGLRDLYQAGVAGGDYDLALQAATQLAKIGQPDYGTVAPGHSTTRNGEILGQAPGVYDIKQDTMFHTTGGGMTPTQMGLGNLFLDEQATDSVVTKNLASAGASDALRDKRLGELEKLAAQDPQESGDMSAKELAAAISKINEQIQSVMQAGKNKELSQVQVAAMLKNLRHEMQRILGLGHAYDEANALANEYSTPDDDSTKEGVEADPEDRIQVDPLKQATMPTAPAAVGGGGFRYDPATGQLVPQ
jgi:hypothetical protein